MLTILYVDDDLGMHDIAKRYLEEDREFFVDNKKNAYEALQALEQNRYDVIVSDYQMPGMDGMVFLRKVRSRYGDVPFIFFTGRQKDDIIAEALSSGADSFLQKGDDPDILFTDLTHAIRGVVRRKQEG